ncbi:unnamed protein product [Coccothraustes coccothraustes]
MAMAGGGAHRWLIDPSSGVVQSEREHSRGAAANDAPGCVLPAGIPAPLSLVIPPAPGRRDPEAAASASASLSVWI